MSGEAQKRLRLLIVESDPLCRQSLPALLADDPEIELIATAITGRTALPKVLSYRPDLLVVDLPGNDQDGLELLAALRREGVTPATLLVADDRPSAVAALGGARRVRCRVAERTAGLLGQSAAELLSRTLRDQFAGMGCIAPRHEDRSAAGLADAVISRPVVTPGAPRVKPAAERLPRRVAEIVGIGVSTGGPQALTRMLGMMPADFPLPIVIVQHMPPGFTASLAESLSRVCPLPVREARAGDLVQPGRVLLAPGGRHMKVGRSEGLLQIRITDDPPEHSCRPAVDYLFRSLLKHHAGATVAVVMTGMGDDGADGCRHLHDAGAHVIAQDGASSTVYGMPRAVAEVGAADEVVPLDGIAAALVAAARWGR